jgi:adenylate cyclase
MKTRARILVVDDHEQNLTLIQVMLRRHGYEAVLARSGEEALQLVEADPPDLILLDVMMPGMDGIEVCRRLKDHEATHLIPVIIMTALDQLEDKIRGIEAGAGDFLTRPVNQAELMARVRTALRLKRTIDRQMGRLLSMKEHLSKFVPMAVRRLVEAHPEAPELARREQDVSVLFVDVSGYTRLSLQMDQDRVDALVERYFSRFLDCIQEHGGDIAETSGDGMMVVVHHADPVEHARQAARAALRILEITAHLNRRESEAEAAIAVHIRVNSGRAMVGSNRFEGLLGARWTFTATGSVANLAARLADVAAPGMILVGEETAQRIRGSFDLEALGARVLKNFDAIEVYRLLGERSKR